ncbi:glycosyltransferase family 4 protein [Novosphingobium humi]|uniref:glycosyltransferase family 4 protein n=1 Tax=Novosphingobium humi TaxID=2282397 RepID=UPI0025AF4C1D|nr:glycosyltransferase family 4 protein [Novosphingobium humi]WJS99313.1 glycosyltransferase family 4 protein [Novosphingobium humi]
MMKVAYVNKQIPFGTTDAFILPEVADHRAHGWDVWFAPLVDGPVLHDRGLLDYTIGAPVLSFGILTAALAETLAHPARTLHLLRQMLRARSLNLKLRNLYVFPKGLWLGRRLRRDGFDHVHIHFAAAPATMGVVAAHVAGVPYSMTAHRFDIALNNLLDWKAGGATFVRAIDGPGADEIRINVGRTPMNLEVLHMGVRVADSPAPRRAGPAIPFRMAIAARLAGKKGHPYLLDAMAVAKAQGVDCLLEVFGDGPMMAELKAQSARLGLIDSIVWHGATAHAALLEALMSGRFDAGVLPSITTDDGDKEGIPVFLIEAMGAGLPVITTPNGGIVELAGDGHGVLVPERDAEALGAAIVRLAHDEQERARLAESGRAHVLAEFEVSVCMKRLRQLMTERTRPSTDKRA